VWGWEKREKNEFEKPLSAAKRSGCVKTTKIFISSLERKTFCGLRTASKDFFPHVPTAIRNKKA
jgi:hypothetical protein